MEITITVERGPIEAQFQGSTWEDIEEELQGFVDFTENNNLLVSKDLKGSDQNEEWKPESSDDPEDPLQPIATKVDTTVDELRDIIYVDPELEQIPQVTIEKDILGGKKAERQRHASYLILYVWKNCYGEERMSTSQLKEILSMAGISESKLANMRQGSGKGFFDSTGRGASSTIALTGPGEREALKYLKSLVEESD